MSQPFKLYRLQQIDSQLDWMQSRVNEIKRELNDTSALDQATQNYNQANQEHSEAQKLLKQAEEAVHQQRLKIEQNESTLYGGKVRNPKELQDLQNEVVALKRYLSVLEDRQLDAMLLEEEKTEHFDTSSAELEKIRWHLGKKHDELRSESDKFSKDIASSENERQATIRTIAPDDLALYERLRQQRRGIAVSKVVDRACSACGTTLNAVLLHTARSPNQITLCDNCGRILYTG